MSQTTQPALTPKRKDGMLARAVERLQQAIADAFADAHKKWAEPLAEAFNQVETAFREHRARAKAPDGGVLAEVDQTSATVARQVDEVLDDHDDLLVRIVALRNEIRHTVKTPISDAELAEIRQRAVELANDLEKNSHTEVTLVQEALNTDIGVGD